jgi:hypothetical protein
MRLTALAFALCAIGCSPSDGEQSDAGVDGSSCGIGTIGDTSQDIAIEITSPTPNGDVVINDGDSLRIELPPQGGRVVFVGVRARNLEACSVQLSGALRDETSMQVRLDARTVNLLVADDGWGYTGPSTQIANYSNIPVCPNQWASTDIFDHPFQLEVTITDRHGRKGTKTVNVVPKCIDDVQFSRCQCICVKGYKLGDPCIVDAGTD